MRAVLYHSPKESDVRRLMTLILMSLFISGLGFPTYADQSATKPPKGAKKSETEAERFINDLAREASDAVRNGSNIDTNALARLYDLAFDADWIVKTVNHGKKGPDGKPLIDPLVIKNIVVNVFAKQFGDFADSAITLTKPRWETGLVQVNGTITPKKGDFAGQTLHAVWRMSCETDSSKNIVCKIRDITVESVDLIEILSRYGS